jgi:cyclic pyranopterin phosphate synthase
MPEDEYIWLPRQSILTYEEIQRLGGVFASLGVSKVRITGGEPLLRQDLPELVQLLAGDPQVRDLSLTTNGILLGGMVRSLRHAGLHRITLSLDSLRPERFEALTRSRRHDDVLEGLRRAHAVGFRETKINTVVVRGFNDDEIVDMIDFARANEAEVRFIEYMDVGGATRWSMDAVVPKREIVSVVERRFGHAEPVLPANATQQRAPADRFALPDGTTFGVIASTTEPFCRNCDRSRLTADGKWLLCLYADTGLDLRQPLRAGATDAELARLISDRWRQRTDRGAEERLRSPVRSPLYQVEALRRDPHREMHTRGG